jgi:transglutaminase-like putative cysteine protease
MITPASAGVAPAFNHPDFSGPVTYSAIERPADDEQATADTTALMAAAIHADAMSSPVRAATAQAIGRARRASEQLPRIFNWIRQHVEFVQDKDIAARIPNLGTLPEETEVLIRPADLLTMPRPRGDCDDFSMLTAAMLRAAGIPSHLQTIEADAEMPGQYSHIWCVAHTPQGEVAMDTSHAPRPGAYARALPGGKSRRWSLDPMIQRKALGDFSTDLSTFDPSVGTTSTNLTPWIQSGAPIPATTPVIAAAPAAPSIWASILPNVIGNFAKAGANVLQMSQTPQGYYQQIGPNGQMVTYRQPSGSTALNLPGLATASSSGLLLMLAGGVVLVLFLARSK